MTKENVTKAEVDKGVADLQKAVDAFKKGKVPVPTKIALATAISDAEKVPTVATSTDGSEVPTTEKWVTAGAAKAFSDAIAAAKVVLADETATQDEVDAAVTALGNAVTAYTNAQKAGTKEVGNREALATAISDAEKVPTVATSTDGSEVPTTEKWVTAEAAKAFSDAIAAAKAVLADETATQDEVNEAVTALGNAVTAYTNAQKAGTKEVGNREALATAISDAEKVPTVATSTDGSEVPPTEKWVTAGAAKAFSDAIAAAKVVLADETATQDEVE